MRQVLILTAEESSKNETLFFAGSDSKKGQAKPALFWREKQRNPKARLANWFCVVFTWFEGGLCPLSNPN
jgi:hypothetical protein